MPCNDVTEVLRLEIDTYDRLTGYALTKLTCGGVLGKKSLLMKWCEGLPIYEIASTTIDKFCSLYPTDDEAVEFVRLKHLVALQLGIDALLGQKPARPDDAITVESIEHSLSGTVLYALIRVEAVTDQIKACGRCSGCSSHQT